MLPSNNYRLVLVTTRSPLAIQWFDRYDLLGRDITRLPNPKRKTLPAPGKRVLSGWGVSNCSEAVVALSKGTGDVIAFFRYNTGRRVGRRSPSLTASGTWVSKSYRGLGLGSKMWQKALNSHKTLPVEVTVSSLGGLALVEGVKRRNPKRHFEVTRFLT